MSVSESAVDVSAEPGTLVTATGDGLETIYLHNCDLKHELVICHSDTGSDQSHSGAVHLKSWSGPEVTLVWNAH